MNEHSVQFEKVKWYYDHGFWNRAMVTNAVEKWITVEEAPEILGDSEKSAENTYNAE
nr:MAG TPA: hypothetical protein [Caudoviricetes sp.]